jgi:GntR family transcriptional regulator
VPPTTRKIEAPVPRWRQIANLLRRDILTGQYPPGQPLPSEEILAGQFGVSRPTVRQGIATLRDEGLVSIRRPYGTVVRDPHARPAIHDERTLTLTGGRYTESGPTFTDLGKPVHLRVDATVPIAAMLDIEPGQPLATREVLQQVADRGTRRAVRLYLPFRVAVDLHTPWADDAQLPPPLDLYSWFAGQQQPPTFREHVRARMPVGDETESLHAQPGTPLLIITRVAHTDRPITRVAHTDRPITVEEIRTPADTTEASYPLPVTRRAGKKAPGRSS